jgi:hypothetical protein
VKSKVASFLLQCLQIPGKEEIFSTILQKSLKVIIGLLIKYLEPVLLFDIFHCPGVWSQLFLYLSLSTVVMFM